MPIHVAVRLHAVLRRHHPGPNAHQPFEVEMASGSNVSALIPALKLPPELVWVASVNGEAVEMDQLLHDGDRVSLFPPVAGGWLDGRGGTG